ncbi:NAD(P)-binding protein [Shewanella sp. 202IG2-18]|uniref:NAD(P)-binding protein n=1 Tax=Parashewanella hymeniacidonis TaxID=2807618 RepID=UPI00195F82E6|nr:NAD(P)-binding protein [Parashewanella hymeniacidonis]MBM7073292.1 NAD(P)-binding protein [Parashewanella hymeniacidonis]
MKKACVIGAGLSGLCSIKELKKVGIDVTCFEKGHYFGCGLSKRNDSGTTYESLMLVKSGTGKRSKT